TDSRYRSCRSSMTRAIIDRYESTNKSVLDLSLSGAETACMQVRASAELRTTIRPGDLGEIVAFQGREYAEQYGLNPRFEAHVAESVAHAGARLALDPSYGRMWLVEDEQGLVGSIAITHEEGTTAKVRWFLVARRARGRGIGRQLFEEAMAYA